MRGGPTCGKRPGPSSVDLCQADTASASWCKKRLSVLTRRAVKVSPLRIMSFWLVSKDSCARQLGERRTCWSSLWRSRAVWDIRDWVHVLFPSLAPLPFPFFCIVVFDAVRFFLVDMTLSGVNCGSAPALRCVPSA